MTEVTGAGLGKCAIVGAESFSAHPSSAAARAKSGTIWVCPAGSDRARGSENAPLATLQEAFARPEVNVNLLPGVYAPATLVCASKYLRAPRGRVILRAPGPDLSAQAFSPVLEGRAFGVRLPVHRAQAPHRILWRDAADRYGFDERLRQYHELDQCLTAEQGWHFDPNTRWLCIRLAGRDVNRERARLRALYTDHGNNAWMRCMGSSLALDGDFILDGLTIHASPYRGIAPYLTLRACTIQFSPSNSVTMAGGASYFERVRSHACRADGFSYDQSDETPIAVVGIERDCWASAAGDMSTYGIPEYPNRNGSSSHGTHIVRLGGLYDYNYGPNVADTHGETALAVSWNVAVLCRRSAAGIGLLMYGGESEHNRNGRGGRTAWLDTCVTEGESADVIAEGGAHVHHHNCRFPKGVQNFQAFESDYDPFSP